MRETFSEALVKGWQDLVPVMQNHEGDRHVLAAAVHAGVSVIVTDNTRHFPPAALEPYTIVTKTADVFLYDLFDLYPDELLDVLHEQVATKNRPPLAVQDILDRLVGTRCPNLVMKVMEYQVVRSQELRDKEGNVPVQVPVKRIELSTLCEDP